MAEAKARAPVPVSLPTGLLEELDRLVDAGVFSSRSEALRYGARLVVLLEGRLHPRAERLAADAACNASVAGVPAREVPVYIDTDVLLALVKDSDWLKAPTEERIRGRRPLRISTLGVIEAQLVLERDEGRDLSLRVMRTVQRRRIGLVPLDPSILREADRLRRQVPVLHPFDGIHLATAKQLGETMLTSDRLFPLLKVVPVETLP